MPCPARGGCSSSGGALPGGRIRPPTRHRPGNAAALLLPTHAPACAPVTKWQPQAGFRMTLYSVHQKHLAIVWCAVACMLCPACVTLPGSRSSSSSPERAFNPAQLPPPGLALLLPANYPPMQPQHCCTSRLMRCAREHAAWGVAARLLCMDQRLSLTINVFHGAGRQGRAAWGSS